MRKNKQNKKKNIVYDIAIIGAGPTGAAFACGLANTKLKIVILDKGNYFKSKKRWSRNCFNPPLSGNSKKTKYMA